MITELIWAILGAAILSGFFALCNYSLREFRRFQLEEAFGPRRKDRLATLERHLPALRLATAFCRSLASLILIVAMVFLYRANESGGLRLLGAMASAWAVIAIFGEAIPHAWAYSSGEKVLAAVFTPLMAIRYALWPVVAVMQAFDVPIRRLSGIREEDSSAQDAKQEILDAASEGKAEGAVNAEEVRMIESVMKFGHREAREVMTPRTDIVAIPATTSWQEACRLVEQHGHTRIPMYEGDLDNIVGVLYAKDLLSFVGREAPKDLRAMMRKPFFVPETKRLDDLLREFKTRKVHIAVVLDEYGGTAGIVSFEDIMEEIVGEISDEYDRTEPALMKRLDDKSSEVDGRMYIDDLNEAMRLEIPPSKTYDTVAGLVFAELGYIPSAGETLEAHGARFTVLAADERRITRVKVERLRRAEATE